MSGFALLTGSSWGTCLLYLIFAWQNCSTVQYWEYITLPWLPVRYHYLGHAYTVSLRFSRWKPGHWWWQLELPEMLILERLVLEMSILEKLRLAEQVWRCRSQCSLESRSNRPWQIGKSPAGLFWWHGHGKEKQGRVVGAAEMGNGWKWNLVSPGGTLSQIHPKQEILLPLSLVMFGDVWGWLIVDSTTCSPQFKGSLSPAIRQHLHNLFNLVGWPGSLGFQTSHFQRLSDKGTNETHHVLEYLGVMRLMFFGKCNPPEWTLVEQLWCRETRQADIKSNAGYKIQRSHTSRSANVNLRFPI